MAKLEPFKPSESLSALLALHQESQASDLLQQKTMVQCIVVLLGKEQVSIPIRAIKEILEVPPITFLPNVPDYILGICSVRGEIVSITDIRAMLQMETLTNKTRKESKKERVILLEGDRYTTGVIVDTVVEVINIPEDEIELSENTLTGAIGRFSDGIYTEGGRMLIVLNVNSLLDSPDLSQFN